MRGREVVAYGEAEKLVKKLRSFTAQYLAPLLQNGSNTWIHTWNK